MCRDFPGELAWLDSRHSANPKKDGARAGPIFFGARSPGSCPPMAADRD
jgi:hypothetical protein